MAATRPRIYMCSCCFIDLVKGSVGKALGSGRDKEVWFVDALLKASANRDLEVYTSTLSVAECTHAGDENITNEVKDLFMRFLSSGKHVVLIQPDVFVAEDARDLRWKHDITLSGADALHVASALSVGCKEFLTTDARRKGPLGQAQRIAQLGINVILPSATGFLPDEYRQTDLTGAPAKPVDKKRPRKK